MEILEFNDINLIVISGEIYVIEKFIECLCGMTVGEASAIRGWKTSETWRDAA